MSYKLGKVCKLLLALARGVLVEGGVVDGFTVYYKPAVITEFGRTHIATQLNVSYHNLLLLLQFVVPGCCCCASLL